MKFRGAPLRYLACLALVTAGICGILLSPSVGLTAGTELKGFTLRNVAEYSWGTAIATSELELPFVENGRGLWFMHCFLLGTLVSLFCGVHGYALLRRRS